MVASTRAFVLRQTSLRPVPGLEEVRLHLADESLPLWHAVLVGIAALHAGAASAAGADVDPLAAAAIRLNARVVVGDPGRRHLPLDDLVELASDEVRTSTELENLAQKQGRVFELRPA